jgi:hypothetical protein
MLLRIHSPEPNPDYLVQSQFAIDSPLAYPSVPISKVDGLESSMTSLLPSHKFNVEVPPRIGAAR